MSRPDYDRDLAAWRERYAGNLAGPYGWWALTTLTWLEPGENLLGSAAEARIPLHERLPEQALRFELMGEDVTITPLVEGVTVDGEPASGPLTTSGSLVLHVDADPQPIRVNLIRRGALAGVRVHDPLASATRDPAREIAWFPTDPAWLIDAEFLPPADGETIAIADVTGQVKDVPVLGRAAFEHEGRRHTLVATAAGVPGRLFFNFRDATNGPATSGPATYGGGRFLNVDGPVDGRILLDFNRAHHPPCAHTPYATCPMPTEENRLPFEITAGEHYATG